MTAPTVCSDFGAQENQIYHFFSSICHEVMGPDVIILVFFFFFLNVEFQASFSLSSFAFIKRLFSSSSFFAIRVHHLHIYGVGNGNPLYYFCLENLTDRGAWWATGHGVAKSQIQLSNWAHLHIWGCWHFFHQSWFQLVIHPAWNFTLCRLHVS